MARVQVFTGVERRRRWSAEQKRAIVSAAFSPGAVVTEVARRADVNSGQIYRCHRTWRQTLRDNPRLLLQAPTPSPFWTVQDIATSVSVLINWQAIW